MRIIKRKMVMAKNLTDLLTDMGMVQMVMVMVVTTLAMVGVMALMVVEE
jgi:hypothetical protein